MFQISGFSNGADSYMGGIGRREVKIPVIEVPPEAREG